MVSACTIYNLRISIRQSSLIFKPVVAVVDVKTTRLLDIGKEDKYDNITFVQIDFIIENKGNLPAKNFLFKPIGTIGTTNLPYTDSGYKDGVTLVQGIQITNIAKIDKSTLDRMIVQSDKLIFTFYISYSDWDVYNTYHYTSKCQLVVTNKDPLNLVAVMLP